MKHIFFKLLLRAFSNKKSSKSYVFHILPYWHQMTRHQKFCLPIPHNQRCVRCSAIEGISYRYHHCGPICMWRIKGKCRGSSLQMAFRIFRCHRTFKPMRGRLTPRLGTSSLLSLHVDVWRLIFLKLSLPRDGVRRCSAPCSSILYVHSFFKNGIDLTMLVMPQVSYACLLLQKDQAMLMNVCVVVFDT
jgi:hypothetical protein